MQAIVELNVAESHGPRVRVRICEWPGEGSCRYEICADTWSMGAIDNPRCYAVDAAHVRHMLDLLEHAQVPASPPVSWGCDGTTYELNLWRGLNSATYTWWLSPPQGYQPLVSFSNELLRLAQLDHRIASFDGVAG